ncbi:MAG: ABC transporter substrate-binding protein [Candidatus Heimdallarchaeaceae archaeon]|jgi:ABC-type transport system substrate-binding protein
MKNRSYLIIIIFLTQILVLNYSSISSNGDNINIIFHVNLLTPDNSPKRLQWSLLIEQTLQKIGIGVYYSDVTSLEDIKNRTWSYPFEHFSYIPSYVEGGYDILFIDKTYDFDWDPSSIFSSDFFVPNGENFYQYSNPTFDDILEDYLTTYYELERTDKAHQLQDILYEDLPSACIVNPVWIFAYREEVSNWNPTLLAKSIARVDQWKTSANNITYAIQSNISKPNIFSSPSYSDKTWMQAVYGKLFYRNSENYSWESVIASDFSITPDGKNVIVSIDSNAQFSDGSPVLAEDIAYSYELHMSPIINSSEYYRLTKWFESNDSIEVVSPDVVTFHLNDSYAFPLSLCDIGIIDKSAVEPLISSYGYEVFNEDPFTGNVSDALIKSCGPFKLFSYNFSNGFVKMEQNPYWQNLTAVNFDIDDFEFFIKQVHDKEDAFDKLLLNEVQILDYHYAFDLGDLEGLPNIGAVITRYFTYEEMAFNLRHPQLGTGELCPIPGADSAKALRKGISHAIPRQIIINEILEGLGTPGIVPISEDSPYYYEFLEPYAYDLDLAIDFVEDAGYEVLQWYHPPPRDPFDFRTPAVILAVSIAVASLSVSVINFLKILRDKRKKI